MSHSPISMLSLTDFNNNVISEERTRKSFDSMMDEHGYVLLVNVPEEFDPVQFCRRLGRFVPNYNGSVVGDIRPEPGMDDVYHAGNTRPLTPHTEGYDFQVEPPRYIALWCVTPVSSGGETTLADTRPWVNRLPAEVRSGVLEKTYDWKTTDGVKRLGLDLKTQHPVLDTADGNTIVRFSCNNLIREETDPVVTIQKDWHDRFNEEHVAIQYERNDMVVWDNWRLLHARNAFVDRGRHLRRLQISGAH